MGDSEARARLITELAAKKKLQESHAVLVREKASLAHENEALLSSNRALTSQRDTLISQRDALESLCRTLRSEHSRVVEAAAAAREAESTRTADLTARMQRLCDETSTTLTRVSVEQRSLSEENAALRQALESAAQQVKALEATVEFKSKEQALGAALAGIQVEELKAALDAAVRDAGEFKSQVEALTSANEALNRTVEVQQALKGEVDKVLLHLKESEAVQKALRQRALDGEACAFKLLEEKKSVQALCERYAGVVRQQQRERKEANAAMLSEAMAALQELKSEGEGVLLRVEARVLALVRLCGGPVPPPPAAAAALAHAASLLNYVPQPGDVHELESVAAHLSHSTAADDLLHAAAGQQHEQQVPQVTPSSAAGGGHAQVEVDTGEHMTEAAAVVENSAPAAAAAVAISSS